jgi:hypothetical protein
MVIICVVLPGQFGQFFFFQKDRKAFITISFLLSNINKNNRNLKLKKSEIHFFICKQAGCKAGG